MTIPLPEPRFTRIVDGVRCLTVTEHEAQLQAYGEAMRREALDQAADAVLADCVPNVTTEYQRQYNITLQSTAATIRSLK